MGKVIVETNYRRFEPVGQNEMCEDCPSSCKTSCARLLTEKKKLDIEEDFKDFKVTFEKTK